MDEHKLLLLQNLFEAWVLVISNTFEVCLEPSERPLRKQLTKKPKKVLLL